MNWIIPTLFPILNEGEVHLWMVEFYDSLSEFEQLAAELSEDEILRAKKLHNNDLYYKFVIIRGKLRQILSQYLQISPSKLIFNYTANGKPFLDASIHFNVSHSQDIAVFAVTKQGAVGIDVQYRRKIDDLEGICSRFLSTRECDLILAHSRAQRLVAFYDIWVKKEAYTKALGGRLFEVLATLKRGNIILESQKKVMVQSFYVEDNYALAIATVCKVDAFRTWKCS